MQIRIYCALFSAMLLALPPLRAANDSFDYSTHAQLTNAWMLAQTGGGNAAWAIATDPSAPSAPKVLKQSGTADFPLALHRGQTVQNGFVEIKFKSLSGKKDQAGGVVWRAADENNYYVCRANALEHNVVLYRTEGGKRKPLDIVGRTGGYGVEARVEPGQWHTLRVDFQGDRFQVTFNGKQLFQVQDPRLSEPGLAGVWTKADSEIVFDDFRTETAK